MAKRNSTRRKEGKLKIVGTPLSELAAATARAKPETDINELPINVINERLDQAHATLDLIYTAVANSECRDEFLETLCQRTLVVSVHSAMLRIEEAIEAAKGVSHG